jgi:hypothetical protein
MLGVQRENALLDSLAKSEELTRCVECHQRHNTGLTKTKMLAAAKAASKANAYARVMPVADTSTVPKQPRSKNNTLSSYNFLSR